MPRIRRGGKRIRGTNGGRTRNEDCCCSDRCDAPDPDADGASYSLDGTSTGWTIPSGWTVDTDIEGTNTVAAPSRDANLPNNSTPQLTLEATVAEKGVNFATLGIFLAHSGIYTRLSEGTPYAVRGPSVPGGDLILGSTAWHPGDVLKITINESNYDGTNADYDIEFFVNGASVYLHSTTTVAIACVFDYGLIVTSFGGSGSTSRMSTFSYTSNF